MQRIEVISYRRFGPTYPSLEDQRSSQIGDPVCCRAIGLWHISSAEGSCAHTKSQYDVRKAMTTSELQNLSLLCHAVEEVHK
jgi:hypothetical protein